MLSDVDTAGGAAVTFLDARGATILEVAGAAGPERLSFVGVRFRDGERVAEVQVRSGSAAIAPGVVDGPQADLAAIDDVIFGEPQADLAPPPDAAVRADDVRRAVGAPTTRPPRRRRLRASLIPLAKSVRAGPHAEGRASAASADTDGRRSRLGKTVKQRSTLEAGATAYLSFKVPAQGQARQAEAQADASPRRTAAKSVTRDGDLALARDARPPSRRLRP